MKIDLGEFGPQAIIVLERTTLVVFTPWNTLLYVPNHHLKRLEKLEVLYVMAVG
jgi:hypothetical protein